MEIRVTAVRVLVGQEARFLPPFPSASSSPASSSHDFRACAKSNFHNVDPGSDPNGRKSKAVYKADGYPLLCCARGWEIIGTNKDPPAERVTEIGDYAMRKSVAVLLVAGLVFGAGVSRADDYADARAIIAKAIRTVGGEEKLARYQAQTWKERATYFGTGAGERYEATYAALWPDKLRVEIQKEFAMVLNGDKGWVTADGKTRDMSKEELEEHREGTYCVWVMSLVPLRDKAFKLAVLGERKVGDRPAAGVRVSHEGHFDVDLYFDKETGLLVRSDTRFKEARTGKEINQENTFSGYKDEEVSGVKSPTKVSIKRDGKRFVEADIELKHIEKLGDGVFAKP
jgi:hypothetical protein